jgi:serine acetyltransferase
MDGVQDMSGRPGLGALLRADLAANRGNAKGMVVLVGYRVAAAVRGTGRRPLWAVPILAVYRVVVDWVLGVELPPSVVAGPGLRIWHGTGLVVHANVRLGADVTLRHNTTLGAKGEAHDAPAPVLGDRVDVGAGAIVLGDLTVGDDAVVGAGAVVVDDVPAGATVVGNPARILAR